MRPILLSLLTTSAAFVSAKGAQCMQDNIEELVAGSFCGDNMSASECLSTDIDLERLDEIEQCFIAAGCTKAEAIVEAILSALDCHTYEEPEGRGELRRRAATDSTSTAATEKSTAKATSTMKTTVAASSTTSSSPLSTDATTTTDSSTSTSASPTASIASSTSSMTTTTSSSGATTSTGSSSSSSTLICSTTNMVSTKVCSVITSGTDIGETIGCTSTLMPVATCAAGNICTTDSAGSPICMKKDDHLTPSGVAVTIVFTAAILGFIITHIIMSTKARQRARRAEAEKEGLLASSRGKGRSVSDVEAAKAYAQARRNSRIPLSPAGGNTSEANLPLITPGDSMREQQLDYFGRSTRSSNSLSPGDQGQGGAPVVPPKLHQGLGALGQDGRNRSL